ncbi:MAG TPA: ABC transporter permease [Mycobacteriales bacterium]|nr:ABC transporter permease [Mycobacteriales bacterium]
MTTSLEKPVATRLRRGVTPGRLSGRALLAAGVVAFGVLSIVRWTTGENQLTSSGTMTGALSLAVPIGLAGLGGLWSERAGVVNIGLEGMMILGTWAGAWAGFQWGPWWGVLAGLVGGALGGLLHAVATVTFGVDHIVSGVAITILAGGLARYLSVVAFVGEPGGGPTNSPPVRRAMGTVTVPVLSGGQVGGWDSPDLLRTVERTGVPVVADLAGVLRGLTHHVSHLTVLAILLVPLTWFVLWRTAFGLRLRSCGENPTAAESLGINVYRMKYVAVVVSGALAGLAGAFLVTVASSNYQEGQTAGRGFIGLAAMIFGNWRPTGLAGGAALFGYADKLQLSDAVHPLLVIVALVLAALAVRNILRRRYVAAAAGAVLAVAFATWFFVTDDVPSQLVSSTPHLVTLLVLFFASQRLRMPAADGQPYRRGQSG